MNTTDVLTQKLDEVTATGHLNLSAIPLTDGDLAHLTGAVASIVEHVKMITLAGCGLTTLPAFVQQCHHLQMLWLYGNNISTLPDTWKNFPQLLLLDVSDNPLNALPGIEDAAALQKLYLNNTLLGGIPESWRLFPALRVFEIEQHQLAGADIGRLPQSLRELKITRGLLGPGVLSIGHLTNLESLVLTNNGIIEMGNDLEGLQKLLILDVSANMLQTLPADIGVLTALEYLDVSSNSLEYIPQSAGKLPLKTGYFQYNRLNRLPDEVTGWSGLNSLQFNFNALEDMPDYAAYLPELNAVDFSNNQFTKIPDWLQKCPDLTYMSFAENPLTSLPDWLGTKDLRCDLSHTNIDAAAINKLIVQGIDHDLSLIINNTNAAEQKEQILPGNEKIQLIT